MISRDLGSHEIAVTHRKIEAVRRRRARGRHEGNHKPPEAAVDVQADPARLWYGSERLREGSEKVQAGHAHLGELGELLVRFPEV